MSSSPSLVLRDREHLAAMDYASHEAAQRVAAIRIALARD